MTDIEPIIPSETALLVLDYQVGIVGMIPESDALVAHAATALATFRAAGSRIGYVRVAFTEDDVRALPPANKLASRVAAMGDKARAESPATAIDPRLAPSPDDIVVRKTRVGPFLTTNLDAQLRAAGVTTLVLAGISTSGVIISTVRDAADRDYRLIVLRDACADPDADVHAFLMDRLISRQADVINVADLRTLIGPESAPGSE
jgi:nicotinamidase-related amidase